MSTPQTTSVQNHPQPHPASGPQTVHPPAVLAEDHCAELHAADGVLHGRQLLELHRMVPEWHIVERDGFGCLQRTFHFPTFAEALAFTDRVGQLSQAEGHHPRLVTEWGRVTVSWWTHSLKGVHRNDFIMAAKTDRLFTPPPAHVERQGH
jgi:4a-hydroxytetrahydrobiopterin dehydratase